MQNTLLKIKDLSVTYKDSSSHVEAVRHISMDINKGECVGIIGESGSGKSSLAAALMRSPVVSREVSGQVFFDGKDILAMTEKEYDKYRWNRIAMVFQNSLDILNPVMTVETCIAECVRKHLKLSGADCAVKVKQVVEQVQLDLSVLTAHPHELSGGMRQRVLIAMAICCDPDLLIADEPTSALDEANKGEIIALLRKLQQERGLTMLVISHEIQTVAALTQRTAVMYGGRIMEMGSTAELIDKPRHPYTRGLLNSCPQLKPYRDLWGISEGDREYVPAECPFAPRCPQCIDLCTGTLPELMPVANDESRFVACALGGIMPILELKSISKTFEGKKNSVDACKNCSLTVYHGEIVTILGESGSGKSTLAMIAAGIEEADSGEILFDGVPSIPGENTGRKDALQIIFQDPFSSINGRLSVEKVISEPLRVTKVYPKENIHGIVAEALRDVGLSDRENFLCRPCDTLSGGQRQRVAIARALVMTPRLLIADEICSMLDSSTQANILRMLKSLQQKRGLSVLFISHDEVMSRKVADRTFRMSEGELTYEKPQIHTIFV